MTCVVEKEQKTALQNDVDEADEGEDNVDDETLGVVGILTAISIEELKGSFNSQNAKKITERLANTVKNCQTALDRMKERKPVPKKSIDKNLTAKKE